MTLSLFVILVIYLIFCGVTLLFFLANLYHLIRFGALNLVTLLFSFISICGVILLVYFSYQYISGIDWGQTFTIFDVIRFKMPSIPKINL
ncbi:MAG: hypothetical protein PHV78_00890 [Patescibacteria group bacterium]|nr:hypothetical protein [Patescibacteria group bacterium]MDD5395804.1 hypothetical protein [Patescibacteria group bacterium]